MDARGLLEAMGLLRPGQEPKAPVKRELIEGKVLFEDELFLSVERDGKAVSYFFLDGQIYLAEGLDAFLASPDLEKGLAAFGVEELEE